MRNEKKKTFNSTQKQFFKRRKRYLLDVTTRILFLLGNDIKSWFGWLGWLVGWFGWLDTSHSHTALSMGKN